MNEVYEYFKKSYIVEWLTENKEFYIYFKSLFNRYRLNVNDKSIYLEKKNFLHKYWILVFIYELEKKDELITVVSDYIYKLEKKKIF